MRLSYFFAAPLLLASQVFGQAIIDRDFAINGCLGLTTILDPSLGIVGTALTGLFTTEGACATACRQRGFQYAYFLGGQTLPTVTSCACSNNAPQISQLLTATARLNVAGTGGICGTANFEAIQLNTNFQLRVCGFADAFTNTAVQPTTQAPGTVASCLSQCSGFAYAIVNYAANGACTCASGTSITNAARLGVCSKTNANNGVYFNSIFPLASRTARRRDLEGRDQAPLGLCPTGHQACLVDADAEFTGADAFECIDTRSELESCGGCLYGAADSFGAAAAGVDCSSLPGVALGGSTCTLGKCEIFACNKGYTLVEGRCLRR